VSLNTWPSQWLAFWRENGGQSVDIRILSRELTPFEHLVAAHLCDGLSNSAIARETAHTEKVVENTVSRMARAFGIKADGDTNIRVLLALAYRSQFGDASFDKLNIPCQHFEEGPDGRALCNRHID
jgi:DNA-binding NarL/FixJ family response regulator